MAEIVSPVRAPISDLARYALDFAASMLSIAATALAALFALHWLILPNFGAGALSATQALAVAGGVAVAQSMLTPTNPLFVAGCTVDDAIRAFSKPFGQLFVVGGVWSVFAIFSFIF